MFTTDPQCFAFGSAAMSALRRVQKRIPHARTQEAIDNSDVMETLIVHGLIGDPIREGALGINLFPTELTHELLGKAASLNLHPVFFPDQEIGAERQMPQGWVKLEAWFYQKIQEGTIASDVIRLYGGWYLADFTPNVDYANGTQVFPNDPLAPIITRLRKSGQIGKDDNTPKGSRFSITHDEWTNQVCPAIAAELGFDAKQVRLERAIEFNFIGYNRYDPKRGMFNSREWFYDSFGKSDRLYGGRFDGGGSAAVYCNRREYRSDFIAGRPLVSFG